MVGTVMAEAEKKGEEVRTKSFVLEARGRR